MQVVMLSGKQGSGKSSIQGQLCEQWYARKKQSVLRLNFADIIYKMHDSVLDILHQYYPKRDIVKDGPLLQLLGTEWGRKTLDENIWVKCLQEAVLKSSRSSTSGGIVVIGDCRFENEFDAFPEALRIRLVCPEPVRKVRCSMWRENTSHPSELGLDKYSDDGKFDLYLHTDSTAVPGCVDLITAQLEKGVWKEKRK